MTRDILAKYGSRIKLAELAAVRASREEALRREFWAGALDLFCGLPERVAFATLPLNLDSPIVTVGEKALLNEAEHKRLELLLTRLLPWRKGPFSLFGHEIDSEWRSDLKWERIEPYIPPLSAKRVADIGCSNGYYLFRMLGLAQRRGEVPELLLGLDPSESFSFQFELFRRYIPFEELSYELLGIEHAPSFPELFDLVLCMGVLYHQRDPVTALRGVLDALIPGGTLILESQAIPGDEPLMPNGRYAKARNVHFVPTVKYLLELLERAGYVDASPVSFTRTTFAEQRTTILAPYQSLADFLDPSDPARTVEGHPAPHRAVILAKRRN